MTTTETTRYLSPPAGYRLWGGQRYSLKYALVCPRCGTKSVTKASEYLGGHSYITTERCRAWWERFGHFLGCDELPEAQR